MTCPGCGSTEFVVTKMVTEEWTYLADSDNWDRTPHMEDPDAQVVLFVVCEECRQDCAGVYEAETGEKVRTIWVKDRPVEIDFGI